MPCEWFSFLVECDLPNWVTLMIELVIGGSIASIFFLVQKRQGDKIKNMAEQQTELKNSRQLYGERELHILLLIYFDELQLMVSAIQLDLKGELYSRDIETKVSSFITYTKTSMDRIKHCCSVYGDVLDPDTLDYVSQLIDSVEMFYDEKDRRNRFVVLQSIVASIMNIADSTNDKYFFQRVREFLNDLNDKN